MLGVCRRHMAVRADRWAQIAASGDDGRKGDGCPISARPPRRRGASGSAASARRAKPQRVVCQTCDCAERKGFALADPVARAGTTTALTEMDHCDLHHESSLMVRQRCGANWVQKAAMEPNRIRLKILGPPRYTARMDGTPAEGEKCSQCGARHARTFARERRVGDRCGSRSAAAAHRSPNPLSDDRGQTGLTARITSNGDGGYGRGRRREGGERKHRCCSA
jgi:hypothetical protein